MSRLAGIYERKGTLFVSPYHKTKAGYWISDGVPTSVDRSDPTAVHRAVIAALSASRDGVATPPPDFDPTGPLLLAAGLSSWNAFARSAKSIAIEQIGDTIEITPDKNMGGREGFVPLTDKVIRVSTDDPHLGAAVIAALDAAE